MVEFFNLLDRRSKLAKENTNLRKALEEAQEAFNVSQKKHKE